MNATARTIIRFLFLAGFLVSSQGARATELDKTDVPENSLSVGLVDTLPGVDYERMVAAKVGLSIFGHAFAVQTQYRHEYTGIGIGGRYYFDGFCKGGWLLETRISYDEDRYTYLAPMAPG